MELHRRLNMTNLLTVVVVILNIGSGKKFYVNGLNVVIYIGTH